MGSDTDKDDLGSDHDDRRRRRDKKKRQKKEGKRSKRRSDDSSESSSSTEEDRRRKRKHKKKRKSRRRRRDDYSSSGDSGSDDDSGNSIHDRRKKRHKKRRRKQDRKHHKKSSSSEEEQRLARNYALADALVDLLTHHPPMAADLPVILVRLASGTTFDLTQMQPRHAATALEAVLTCLQPFGVGRDHTGSWAWTSPTGTAAHNNTNELVLVRIVRAMLEQIGLTIEAMDAFENPPPAPAKTETRNELMAKTQTESAWSKQGTPELSLKERVERILDTFANGLSGELAGLCQMIVDGESVSLDGLPDENLRQALQNLLESCGLEQAEMDADEDDEAEPDEPSMGYVVPDDPTAAASAQAQLARIMAICRAAAARPSRIQGPKRPPTNYQAAQDQGQYEEEDEEDEGPSLTPRMSGSQSTSAMIEAQAVRRQKELSHVAAGQGALPEEDNSGREEWMVTPGKSDFFDFIKTGQPMKSRKFQGKAKQGARNEEPMDPTVKAEVDAIMRAHQTARGPSLMEEHQAARKAKQEQQAAAQNKPWKWTRDKDLDAGRRVDKDALQMVFGGAATGLQSKFQGGLK